MRGLPRWSSCIGAILATCAVTNGAAAADTSVNTTTSAIAIVNLDQQILQLRDEAGVEELLLVRSRFLGDYDALDRASALAERRSKTPEDLLRRARTRSATHRFADALADIKAAEVAGARRNDAAGLRASILVAMGHAKEVVPELEADARQHPGYASHGALAIAYAMVGRLAEADNLYLAALSDLDTTSPFPYAWIYFARGLMWAEQGGDTLRAEALYLRALAYVPGFVAANIHVAELEVARGDLAPAVARLERTVAASNEPEALALLGVLHARTGDPGRGAREVSLARERYESLLARYPLAFADHAAEFYLRPGEDAERAWALAQQNLANRETRRAVVLAIRAAEAAGRYREAYDLARRYRQNSAIRGVRTNRESTSISPLRGKSSAAKVATR